MSSPVQYDEAICLRVIDEDENELYVGVNDDKCVAFVHTLTYWTVLRPDPHYGVVDRDEVNYGDVFILANEQTQITIGQSQERDLICTGSNKIHLSFISYQHAHQGAIGNEHYVEPNRDAEKRCYGYGFIKRVQKIITIEALK